MQIAFFQRNGCIGIQRIAPFITNAYPPAGSLAAVCVGIGVDTVILFCLRRKELRFICRICTDQHIRIYFQMLFQNVMYLLLVCDIFGFQFICCRNCPVAGRNFRNIGINQF